MYKIGDKVETPLGIGIVVGKRVAMRHDDIIFEVEIKGIKIDFRNTQVTPYQSAHEKLIELGYEYSYKECGDELSDKWHTFYNKKRFITIDVIVNNISGIGWYITFHDPFNCIANIELSRILTQYLEELEAKE